MRDLITTARLTLRRSSMDDAPRICALLGNYEVAKMLARAPHPYEMRDAINWLSKHDEMWATGVDLPFVVTTAQDGLIGAIGLHKSSELQDLVPGAFEVGYWYGQPYWGKGYATEAVRGLLTAFDEDHPGEPLIAGHFTENPQSGHVLEKLGFQYVGGETPFFSLARNSDVLHRLMLRPAPAFNSNPERSPTP